MTHIGMSHTSLKSYGIYLCIDVKKISSGSREKNQKFWIFAPEPPGGLTTWFDRPVMFDTWRG